MKKKPTEQLSYRGKWNRNSRHVKRCTVCRPGQPCIDCPPHPGETKDQRHERVVQRAADLALLTKEQREAYKWKACISCGARISKFMKRDKCMPCLRGLAPIVRPMPKYPITCYYCLAGYKGDTCPDCGTPYNEAKQAAFMERNTKSYLDIISENAKKEGKSVKGELRKARLTGFIDPLSAAAINKKLAAYLKKKGFVTNFNGKIYG